ncbi:MAG: F0F1 ATP synthase subunit A [Candidatus Kapaibacteriota bacterium]
MAINSVANSNNFWAENASNTQSHLNATKDTLQTSKINAESHNAEEGNVISDILQEHLLDHHGYNFFDVFHIDLPIILYDDQLYAYPSMKSMLDGGTFTEIHHNIVRKDTHQPPKLDLSITSLVMFQWLSIILLLVTFFISARKYKKNPTKGPKGFQNLLEVLVIFIRDDIVKPNIQSPKLANTLSPYFVALFFFILVMNLFGLIPGGHSATGNLAVTAGLAITAYFVINGSAIFHVGFKHWLKEFTGGAPWGIWIIMIPIEILSMFTKPFALTIRLFANMTAGHVIIFSLLGLIFMLHTLAIVPISIGFSLFIYILELLVAFIQAYVFTILTAVFVGLVTVEHSIEH